MIGHAMVPIMVESNPRNGIFGYLHLLVTASGVIVDFELAPLLTDLSVGYELFANHHKQVIGWLEAYINVQIKDQWG